MEAFFPFIFIVPLEGFIKPQIKSSNVDLPHPLLPVIIILDSEGIVKFKLSNIVSFFLCSNLIFFYSIDLNSKSLFLI